MAAKFDAEMLKKHHFWFLFIPTVIGLLVAWYALFIEVPDAISGAAAQHEEGKKKIAYQAKPRGLVDEYKKNVTKLDAERIKKWSEAWEEQKDLYPWPAGYSRDQLSLIKDLKFGAPGVSAADDAPTRKVMNEIRRQFEAHYQAEYKQFVAELEPLQFRGRWEDLLRYKGKFSLVPDAEDMWLAMEDLWVQREILRRVAAVNTEAAKFDIVRAADGKDDPKNRVFKSRIWQLDLKLTGVDNKRRLEGTLTNVSPRLQVMGVGNRMILNVWLSPNAKEPFPFEVQGGAVEAGATIPIKPLDKHEIPADVRATELAKVQQEFDVRTVPIKRVEHFSLGKLDARHVAYSLLPPKFSEDMAAKQPGSTSGQGTTGPGKGMTGTPGTAGTPGTSNTGSSMPSMSMGSGPDSGQTANDETQNGLKRARYIARTEQVRRMPVALAVVTDQTYIKDILESLANTKLRYQITQVHWSRYHNDLNYTSNRGMSFPGSGRGGEPGKTAPPEPGKGFGSGSGFDFGSAPTTSREDQFSANLLEVSVYGIVSLYTKFYTTIDQGDIAPTATSMTVASELEFLPTPFEARIDREVVQVTKIDKKRWTIVRGANGTKPAAHSAKAEVYPEATGARPPEKKDSPSGKKDLPSEKKELPAEKQPGKPSDPPADRPKS